ncbi:MAG: lipid A biosynthesis acyltransferase [Burkholderiaceae bacterium]|jgi:KDO2-lipid IV(A) lauroyltransferase
MTRLSLWLLRLLGGLPLGLVRLLGGALGGAFYFISKERRSVALTNVGLCFPDLDAAERRKLARAHFGVFAQALLDRGFLWWGSPAVVRKRVHWAGFEHFEAARARKAVILLAPHFVGLDAGGILATLTWRIVSIYSNQKNPLFNEAVLAGRRRFNDPVLLSRQDGVRGALKALRQGLPFYYLPDMDFGARDAIFIPFFGVPAATVTAVPRLAALADALVVPCVTRMTPEGYEVRLYPAWEDFPGDSLISATERMNAFIEARVREMPDQYLWTHKRFKTRPAGERSFYDAKATG